MTEADLYELDPTMPPSPRPGDLPMTSPTDVRRSGGLMRHRQADARTSSLLAAADPSASRRSPSAASSLVLVKHREAETETGVPEPVGQADDTPATRADVARLEAVVSELLDREESRAEILARIEAVGLSLLADLATMRQRLDAEDLAH